MTHICVGELTIIGSDNGLSPERRQAIIWTNAGILLIGPLGTNFSEILIEIQRFSLKKIRLKMSSVKCCSFRLGLNVLILWLQARHWTSFPGILRFQQQNTLSPVINGILQPASWFFNGPANLFTRVLPDGPRYCMGLMNNLMIPVSYGFTQCYVAGGGSFNFHFIARINSCIDFIQTIYSDCNVSTYSNHYLARMCVLLQSCVFIYVYECYLTCYFIPVIVFIMFLLYFCTT